MKVVLYVISGVVAVVAAALAGFLVKPGLFPMPASSRTAAVQTMPVPEDLPAPVDRWLRTEYPDGLPMHTNVYMRGTGVMRFGPVAVPFRHQVELVPGEGFVRRMDLTWYGMVIARGKDTYVDGRGFMKTPVGGFGGDKIDQGADVVNWLEALAVPAAVLGDRRVRWEPVDDTSARLVYPHGGGEDSFVLGFDPKSGLPSWAKAQRYKDADATAEKLEWTATMKDRKSFDGVHTATVVDATWEGASKPWATFRMTDVRSDIELVDYAAAQADPKWAAR